MLVAKIVGLNRGNGRATEMNLSFLWDELIREAAKCNKYASDLMLEYQNIMEAVNNAENKTFLLGFREMGVDSKPFITANEIEKYRCTYIINIFATERNYYGESWVTVSIEREDKTTLSA